MGLSNLPAPSEGMLSLLLVNTALSISMVKEIVRSILHVVGIRRVAPASDVGEMAEEEVPPLALAGEFRARVPATRFGLAASAEHECAVCLTRFEPESEVSRLTCGHVFHRGCLQRWVEYWNVTCPLCRAPLVQEDDPSCPWF